MTFHIDGFDQFEGDAAVTDALTRAGYEFEGSPAISRDEIGGRVLLQNSSLTREYPWTGELFSAGINSNFTSRGSQLWLEFEDGSKVVCWTNPTTGAPTIGDGVGSSLPIKNTPYYFEIELTRSESRARLYINGRYETTTLLTPAQANDALLKAGFGVIQPDEYGASGADGGMRTCRDFYVSDGARLGPIRITTRFPTADVDVDWLLAGDDEAWKILETLPPQLIDRFISSENIDDVAKVRSEHDLPNNSNIMATGLVILVRKSPDVDVKLQGFIGGDGGAVLRSQDMDIAADWKLRYISFDRIMSDNKSNIEDARFGLRVIPPV